MTGLHRKNSRTGQAVLLLALAFASSGIAAPSREPWQRQVLASAAPFIDRANSDWSRAILVGNADAIVAPYAADGMMIGPDGSVFHGRAAVRQVYAKGRPGVRVVKASIRSDGRAAHDPSHVYEWGTAWLTLREGKSTRHTSGKYLTVWHREGARWVITHDIVF